jgi:hypothetical protein
MFVFPIISPGHPNGRGTPKTKKKKLNTKSKRTSYNPRRHHTPAPGRQKRRPMSEADDSNENSEEPKTVFIPVNLGPAKKLYHLTRFQTIHSKKADSSVWTRIQETVSAFGWNKNIWKKQLDFRSAHPSSKQKQEITTEEESGTITCTISVVGPFVCALVINNLKKKIKTDVFTFRTKVEFTEMVPVTTKTAPNDCLMDDMTSVTADSRVIITFATNFPRQYKIHIIAESDEEPQFEENRFNLWRFVQWAPEVLPNNLNGECFPCLANDADRLKERVVNSQGLDSSPSGPTSVAPSSPGPPPIYNSPQRSLSSSSVGSLSPFPSPPRSPNASYEYTHCEDHERDDIYFSDDCKECHEQALWSYSSNGR